MKKPFIFYVTEDRKHSGNVCPTERQLYALSTGVANGEEFDVVEVRVQVTNEVVFAWHQTYSHLLQNVSKRYHDHSLYSYKPIKKQMAIDAKARNEEYMTQEEIAEHYNFHACRVAILKNFAMLKVAKKNGKTELFNRGQVLGLVNNEHFRAFLANNYERNSA